MMPTLLRRQRAQLLIPKALLRILLMFYTHGRRWMTVVAYQLQVEPTSLNGWSLEKQNYVLLVEYLNLYDTIKI